MSMRTPLGKVRGLGSAKEGTGHFWMQRVTAVANVPLTLVLVLVLINAFGADHATVVALLGSPVVAILMLALVVSGIWHMKLGMQVIIEDYVHGEGAKVACLLLNMFFAAAVGIGCVWAIAKISFGI